MGSIFYRRSVLPEIVFGKAPSAASIKILLAEAQLASSSLSFSEDKEKPIK